MTEHDKYIGEWFEDSDNRGARRIKITEHAPATATRPAAYYYQRIDLYGQLVGPRNRVRISAKTIDKNYRKVSH